MLSTTTRGLNRDEWLTRDEIAGLMGRTEDTVRRLQRENALRARSGENGKVLLRLGDLIDLGKISESVLDPQVSAREVAEAVAVRRELQDVREERCELAGRLAAYEERVSELLAHIATLNTLISVLRSHRASEVAA